MCSTYDNESTSLVMEQASVGNERVTSPNSSKVPPPLPPNPPRSLPPGSGRRSSSTASPTVNKLGQFETQTADKIPPPLRPSPPCHPRSDVHSSRTSASPEASVSDETVFSVVLKSTPVRQPSGSLLSIGRRDAMMFSAEVRADDGTVYRRNASGVYFQVDQTWTAFDGSVGLEVGDEVLAIDSYKMVDMSVDTAR